MLQVLVQSLVATKLCKSLAKEAADDYLEVEICDEFRAYAEYDFFHDSNDDGDE